MSTHPLGDALCRVPRQPGLGAQTNPALGNGGGPRGVYGSEQRPCHLVRATGPFLCESPRPKSAGTVSRNTSSAESGGLQMRRDPSGQGPSRKAWYGPCWTLRDFHTRTVMGRGLYFQHSCEKYSNSCPVQVSGSLFVCILQIHHYLSGKSSKTRHTWLWSKLPFSTRKNQVP